MVPKMVFNFNFTIKTTPAPLKAAHTIQKLLFQPQGAASNQDWPQVEAKGVID